LGLSGEFQGNEYETGRLVKQVDLRGLLNPGGEEKRLESSGTRRNRKADRREDGLHLPGGYMGARAIVIRDMKNKVGSMIKILITATWCLAWSAAGWAIYDANPSGAYTGGVEDLTVHLSRLTLPESVEKTRFYESNEARTDKPTSVVFGLLAVSNQRLLGC